MEIFDNEKSLQSTENDLNSTFLTFFAMTTETLTTNYAILSLNNNEDDKNASFMTTKLSSRSTSKARNISFMQMGQDDDLNKFYFYETEQFTVLWILFTVIVLGNSAVLITLFSTKSRKSRMNFFIKHLAIADLSVGLLNVLTDIIWRITVSWEAGNVACKLIKFIQCLTTYASTYVLVALSIDRYDAITHPMNFSGSWKRAKILVFTAWLLSALFSTPQILLYEETSVQGRTQCWIDLGEPWCWQLYMLTVSTVLFILPALIISLCYAIIVKTIWENGTYLGASKNGIRKNHAKRGDDEDDDRGSRRASSRGIIPKAKVKTIKMTFVIVIVFILCWSPYIVFDLLQVFDQIPRTQTNIAVATFIQSLAPLNSAANPLIYCMFSAQISKNLRRKKIFRWFSEKLCCQKSDLTENQFSNGRSRGRGSGEGGGASRNFHQNYNSTRTFTTSLTVGSRRSTALNLNPHRVVIVENENTILAKSNENER